MRKCKIVSIAITAFMILCLLPMNVLAGEYNTASKGTDSEAGTVALSNSDTNYRKLSMIPYYTVTYDPNGGSGMLFLAGGITNSHTVLTVESVGFSRTGYTFKGWNTQADGGGTTYAPGDILTVTSNITLYAQWEEEVIGQHYTVAYDPNGGSGMLFLAGGITNSHTVLTVESVGFSRAGYTFKGWNTQADGGGTAYAPGEIMTVTGSITLYAQWKEQILYNVIYDSNGGSGTAPTESPKAEGENFAAATNTFTAPAGLRFGEWNTQRDGQGISYTEGAMISMPAGDLTLYPIWEPVSSTATYTVDYNANGGSGSHTDTDLTSGSTYTVLNQSDAGINRDGFTFKGWNTAADGSGVAYAAHDTFTVTGNMTLFAQWKKTSTIVNPNTGGTGNTGIWAILLCISLTGIVYLLSTIPMRKRQRRKY